MGGKVKEKNFLREETELNLYLLNRRFKQGWHYPPFLMVCDYGPVITPEIRMMDPPLSASNRKPSSDAVRWTGPCLLSVVIHLLEISF